MGCYRSGPALAAVGHIVRYCMARPLRLEFAGAAYHITSRGNARQEIFLDDGDRRCLLDALGAVLDQFGWLCHAYCLMGNHYHLMVETPGPNLSRGMRQLNGLYTQRFNRRHRRVGHVFQGRFHSVIVDREAYLLELCRYIVLNPVRAGLAACADAWAWSSYRATAGLAPAPAWLSTAWVLQHFGPEPARAQARYREFVTEGHGRQSPWEALRGEPVIGSRGFVERLAPALATHVDEVELPKRQRLPHRAPLDELLAPSEMATKASRDRAIRRAFRNERYTLGEIGRHVGLHYATVSRIARLPERGNTRPDPD